jgi:hypothetical protein
MTFRRIISSVLLFITLTCIQCRERKQEPVAPITVEPVIVDRGDLVLTIREPQNEEHQQIYSVLKSDRAIDHIIQTINSLISLPKNIPVIFEDCQEDNAFYDSETGRITMCYELINHYLPLYDSDEGYTYSMKEKIEGAATFTLLHEVGHALIDQLNLTYTGKEEAAVDEFAMIILLKKNNDTTISAALDGLLQFYQDAQDENVEDYLYFEVHPLSKQRYDDLLRIFVGALPEFSEELIGEEEGQLPPDEVESAIYEYNKKLENWNKILKGYIKIQQ